MARLPVEVSAEVAAAEVAARLPVAASVVAAVPVAVKAFLKYLKDLEPAALGLPSLSRSQSALASEAVAVEPVEAMADFEPPSIPLNRPDILSRRLHLRNQTSLVVALYPVAEAARLPVEAAVVALSVVAASVFVQ